jgi:hypothetical protein
MFWWELAWAHLHHGFADVPVTLFCKLCRQGYGCTGEPPAYCPLCRRETRWTLMAPQTQPVDGWRVSENDRRFLRSLRIDPE